MRVNTGAAHTSCNGSSLQITISASLPTSRALILPSTPSILAGFAVIAPPLLGKSYARHCLDFHAFDNMEKSTNNGVYLSAFIAKKKNLYFIYLIS